MKTVPVNYSHHYISIRLPSMRFSLMKIEDVACPSISCGALVCEFSFEISIYEF